MSSNTLEPGTVIRPIIDHATVKDLAERLYGISVLELTELNGYDDKNYRIIADSNAKAKNYREHGYVLKIMNSIDTQNAGVVEAQNEIMTFLGIYFAKNKTIKCPKPIRNVYGHLYSIETIGGKQHAVRLLEYVPGELLHNVDKSEELLYQLGEFTANLDNKLEKFNHSGVVTREHTWMLAKVPDLDKFMYAVKDHEKYELALQVIEEFKRVVVPVMDDLEKGVIHGDINDMNVLVGPKRGSTTEYSVIGVIDFGDIQYSCYVFELAITMLYVIVETGDLRAGGYVFAGYVANRNVTDAEYRLLKLLIASRLVQSLVIGAYTLQQDPTNIYVASTERSNGWEILKKLWNTNSEEPGNPCDWKTIALDYLARS